MPLYLKDKLVSGTGTPGKSAYKIAVEAGYMGTETAFNEALSNVPGHIDNTDNPHGVTAEQTGAYSTAETDALLVNKRSWKGGIVTGVSILDWASSQNIPTDCACDNSVTDVPYSSYWMVQLSLFPEAGYKTLVAKSIMTGEVWSIGCNINTWDSWRKHFDSATMKPSDIGAVSADEMTEAINTALGDYPAALAAMDVVIGGASE